MDRYKVKLTFTEQLLGTVPLNKKVYAEHGPGALGVEAGVLTPEGLDEELATIVEPEEEEKTWTGFHTQDGQPFLYSYVIKGFFKETCSALRRDSGWLSKGLRAHKKVIDGLVFVEPRKIMLDLHGQAVDKSEDFPNKRPLRGQTALGERISIARSHSCPPSTSIEFTLLVLGGVTEALLNEWLHYGRLKGLGCWRNADWGRFIYEMERLPSQA